MLTLKLTTGHLKLFLFVVWMVGCLPLITWLTLSQFFLVNYPQVFMPYILLYGLLISLEIVRGFVAKGGQ